MASLHFIEADTPLDEGLVGHAIFSTEQFVSVRPLFLKRVQMCILHFGHRMSESAIDYKFTARFP